MNDCFLQCPTSNKTRALAAAALAGALLALVPGTATAQRGDSPDGGAVAKLARPERHPVTEERSDGKGADELGATPEPSAPRPLLERLDRETRSLYREVRGGVVRVQLPSPRWAQDAAARDNPLNKYQNLNKEMREQIARQAGQQRRAADAGAYANGPGNYVAPRPPEPVTQPAAPSQGARAEGATPAPAQQPQQAGPGEGGEPPRGQLQQAGQLEGRGTIIVVPAQNQQALGVQQQDAALGGKLAAGARADAPAFAPNNIGLLLDDAGHVLVPTYVDRESAGAAVRLAGIDGVVRDAKFVGSDRQTNLTVLKLDAPSAGPAAEPGARPVPGPAGWPVRFGRDKPTEGSLVLFVGGDGAGRLGLWAGGAQEFCVVFTTSGEAAGVARYGQFLGAGACRLIAEEIIRHGSVKRAALGVIVTEIRSDDPLRQQTPVLGSRTAMRVDEVVPDSAAGRAGLREGDLLLSLAGEAVSDIPSFAAAIATRSGRTELQVLRGGRVLEIVVDLRSKRGE